MRGEDKAMKAFGPRRPAARDRRRACTAAVIIIAGAALAACQTADPGPVAVAAPLVPVDYRIRHPLISIENT
jgi:hypothetical protein